MKRYGIQGVVLAALSWAALPAAAQVDEQCLQRWQSTVSTRVLAERCNALDAATAAKLKALEDSSLACAMAKASAADKAQMETAAAQYRQSTAAALAQTPCDESAKAAVAGHATKQLAQ